MTNSFLGFIEMEILALKALSEPPMLLLQSYVLVLLYSL
ncbi:hypothetical protein CASFOL_011596 [Castilleja foliolosa]|uniref:Uncharacterized protein n=1 Tax=Castilleja foliolosa TaxID=1961234 RepID=A0ABD3DVX8_9LAMI